MKKILLVLFATLMLTYCGGGKTENKNTKSALQYKACVL